MKKRLLRLILNTVLIFLCIPFALTFLFLDPMIQTLSARMVTAFLSSGIDNDLSIKSISISFRTGITLSGILVNDQHGRAMIKIDHLSAVLLYADFGLFGLKFSQLNIDRAEFRYGRYAGEEEFNLKIFIEQIAPADSTKQNENSFKIQVGQLKLNNGIFHFFDEQKKYDNGDGMDYANMIFNNVNLESHDFNLIGDSLFLKIDNLTVEERSGFKVNQLKADFSISSSGLKADGLKLIMDNSNVDMDLEFKIATYKTFTSFIDSVQMFGNFRPSSIRMSDIGYFSEVLHSMQNDIGVTGKVFGTVSNLQGHDLKIHYLNNTRFSGNVRIVGLPDFFTSRIDAEIIQFTSTSCDLKSFALPIEEKNVDFTDEFDCIDPFRVSGSFKGSYYDFITNLNIEFGDGHLQAKIAFTEVKNDTVFFKAELQGDSIDIGKVLHQEDLLGNLDLDIVVEGSGKSYDNLVIRTNGLLSSVDLMGYNYRRISMDALYRGDTLKADLKVGDKHLMMAAKGMISLDENPLLVVNADIRRIDFDNLKIWEGKDLRVQTIADIRLKGFDISTMTGTVTLTNSQVSFSGEDYSIKNIQLQKYRDEDSLTTIKLNSDIVDLEMVGKYDLVHFPDQLFSLLNNFYNAFPIDTLKVLPDNEYADVNIDIKKSNLIEEQFLPGIELYAPLAIQARFDFRKDELNIESKPVKLAFKGVLLNENSLKISTKNDRINIEFNSENVIFKDSTEDDKTVFGLDNLRFTGAAGFNLFNYGLYWDNKDSLVKNSGLIEGYVQTLETSSRLKLTSTRIYLSDTLWRVDDNNLILIDSSGTNFQDVTVYGGISELSIAGKLPQKNNDSLNIFFNRWNLSNFDFITRIYNFNVEGIVLGNLNISMVNDHPTVISDVTVNDLYLNKEYLGTASLLNTWDNVNSSIFVNARIIREGSSGKGEVFAVDGYYFPFKDEESLNFDIRFNRFKLKTIEAFIADFVSHLEGQTSGELSLRGSIDKPILTGRMDMRRTSLLVNYLNTKYSFSNEIKFFQDQINFDNLVIYDTLGNFANVDGSLNHNYFSDLQFDVKISTDKLLFFNTTRKMNSLYYGSAITSGNIAISGSPKNIHLDMDVKTQGGTDVKLPLDYGVEISDKDYIIFVEHIDSLDMELEELEGKAKLEEDELTYEIGLGMQITPVAKVTIFLPSDMGRIESQGKGDLKMNTNSSGELSLIGDYVLEEGLFHFSLANLVRKRFDLVRGGRISWTGDPYKANVSIKGLYRLKTNLSSLGIVIDSSSTYANKVNVECYVILQKQLMNPDIRFEIKLPDLDPDLQRLVFAELDTTNSATMNQQMISLLVLGTFSASNASNISLSSSYYTVISNQLSSMLSKISDDFDIGINYRPGDNVSEEEFEVALSTQLFDDRLMIDGHFGMTYDKSQQNASNIVGDVDIGYKLTEDGRWILKAFNHSNVNSWYNYNNYDKIAPYTQGVGIAFRKEFTSVKELFQRTRPKKERKGKNEKKKD